MFFIEYAFKGQVHVFAGRVKLKSLALQGKSNIEIFLSPVHVHIYMFDCILGNFAFFFFVVC